MGDELFTGVTKPNEFNETVRDLRKNLSFCWQDVDGTIFMYEGTLELLFKLVGYFTERGEQQ